MIQNDQVNATEESTLEVDAADGVLANDTSPNGPLTVVEGLYRTTGGGQIYFFSDGSYDYVSAPGFSGTDTVQYTALDNSSNVAGTATLTIDVAATALLPFVSIGTQLGVRQVVTAGFPEVGNGIDTNAGTPVPLTGGGYVIAVTYLDQNNGATNRVQTYDANGNLVGTLDPGVPVYSIKTAALADGDYIVAWDTGDPSPPTRTGHVELFSATGAALAGPISLTLPAGATGISQIAALPGGGFVALQEDHNLQLYAWSFNAAGVPASQPYMIGPSGMQRPSLAVLPDGEIVFAQIENGDEVHVQRYDALGNPIGSEILPPSDGNVIDPMSVTVMPHGGFAVAWESIISNSNPREELSHVQLVDANGDLVGNQAQTDFFYSSIFGAPFPRVTPLANGGFVTSWRGIVDNGVTNEGVQAYDANGNAVGSLLEFQDVSAFGATFARVFALPQGGFAVVLESAYDTNSSQNLHIYDNGGNYVGDVRMEDAGDGSDFSNMLLANQPDGNTLVLYDVENNTLVSSRETVQTLNLNNGTSTPSIQTGILFKQNTVGTVPVVVSIPDPDGSEIVQWIDVAGVPAGWTLSDPGATAAFDGFEWKIIGGNVTHGGEIDLSLTPPANFVGSETLTVTAHVVDTGNGTQNQSIPVTFNVTVKQDEAPTGLTLSDASIVEDSPNGTVVGSFTVQDPDSTAFTYSLLDNANGLFAVKGADLVVVDGARLNAAAASSEQITAQVSDESGLSFDQSFTIGVTSANLEPGNSNTDIWQLWNGSWASSVAPGSHPADYQVVGVGDFNHDGTSDILWQSSSIGDVDEWKIVNGHWAGSIDLGSHPESGWQIGGVGDFNGDGTSDVMWFNPASRQTDIWELQNGQWAASASPGAHPAGYTVAGTGDWTGNGTDGILWYNANTGDTDEWQINNGHWSASVDLGFHPGTGWSIAGVGDFSDNGRDDVLWTNASGGSVQTDIWELGSNGQWINSVSPGAHPAGYSVVGVGDFTGTGTSDILWYNASTGDTDEWLIKNGQWAGSIDLGTHSGSAQIAGVGDFNRDGTKDILWHSPS